MLYRKALRKIMVGTLLLEISSRKFTKSEKNDTKCYLHMSKTYWSTIDVITRKPEKKIIGKVTAKGLEEWKTDCSKFVSL